MVALTKYTKLRTEVFQFAHKPINTQFDVGEMA